jgi:hypothetical protein
MAEQTTKVIVFRKLSGNTSEVFDWYDHYAKEGYIRFPSSDRKCITISGTRLSGVLAKPDDIKFIREQAAEKAKADAGYPVSKLKLRKYKVITLPQGLDWDHWEKEISNSRRNIKQVMDALSQYNLGGFKLPDSSTLKVSDYMMKVRDSMADAYLTYYRDLQDPTNRMKDDAVKAVEEYENERSAKKELKNNKAKPKKDDTKDSRPVEDETNDTTDQGGK